MFFHGGIKKYFLQFKLCHEGSNWKWKHNLLDLTRSTYAWLSVCKSQGTQLSSTSQDALCAFLSPGGWRPLLPLRGSSSNGSTYWAELKTQSEQTFGWEAPKSLLHMCEGSERVSFPRLSSGLPHLRCSVKLQERREMSWSKEHTSRKRGGRREVGKTNARGAL